MKRLLFIPSTLRVPFFCMAILMAVLLTGCQTDNVNDLIKTAPDRAAKLVVKSGNVYCKLPYSVRMDFRQRVKEQAELDGGAFMADEITCVGDDASSRL